VSARAAATSPAAPAGRSTSVRISGRAGILLFTLFLITVVSIAPTRVWLEQRARLRELERQAAALETTNERLADRLAELRDPDTLERLARECLGMVEPGEIAIITVPRRGPPTPPRC
jgi:cell division protein FtsB